MKITDIEWKEGNVYEVFLPGGFSLKDYVVKGNYLRRVDDPKSTLHWPIRKVCRMDFKFKYNINIDRR